MMYGLIGEKLGHSFSKEIHAQIGDYDYRLCELSREAFREFFAKRDFLGVNVTIPYKQTVIPLLDEISDSARKIGAVNTVVNRDGKLWGYNTDYLGAAALIRRTGVEIRGKRVLILGTGGTSKTLRTVVSDMEAGSIAVVSRRHTEGAVTYDEAVKRHGDAQVIINTTPAGMYPDNDGCPLELSPFSKLEGVIDVIYNPIDTCFVQAAKKRGLKASGGLYMLAAQAVYASELFTGAKLGEAVSERVYQAVLHGKQNIVLVGMPSCGKTTVGERLAKLTGRTLYDTDAEIVKQMGRSITDIFAKDGEEAFRRLEHETVAALSKCSGVIIATGGGAVLDPENVRHLAQNGVLFFLDRPLELLMATKDRPLSSDRAALQKRFEERYPIYLSCADVRIQADKPAAALAEMIWKEMST